MLTSLTWKEREENLARAFRIVARMHNALQITRPIPEDVQQYFGRPYKVFEAPDLVRDILMNFTDDEVKAIKHGLGSVNQFVDSTDQLSHNPIVHMLKEIYRYKFIVSVFWGLCGFLLNYLWEKGKRTREETKGLSGNACWRTSRVGLKCVGENDGARQINRYFPAADSVCRHTFYQRSSAVLDSTANW